VQARRIGYLSSSALTDGDPRDGTDDGHDHSGLESRLR
jgi:hypothetical protein